MDMYSMPNRNFMRLHKTVSWLEHWQNKSGPLFYLMLYRLLAKYKNEAFSQRAINDWNELAAWLLYKYHDDKLALDASHKAIEVDAGCKDSWYMEAVAYEEMGEYNKSLSALNEAVKIDKKFIEAREMMARIYTRLGLFREAHNEYMQLAQVNNRYQPPWQDWAMMLAKHGKCSEIAAASMEGMGRCKDTQFWFTLGNRLALNYLHWDQAFEAYDRAVACDSSNAEAITMKVLLMEKEVFYQEQLESHAKNLL